MILWKIKSIDCSLYILYIIIIHRSIDIYVELFFVRIFGPFNTQRPKIICLHVVHIRCSLQQPPVTQSKVTAYNVQAIPVRVSVTISSLPIKDNQMVVHHFVE